MPIWLALIVAAFGWLVAGVALTVAVLNYRRSHLPLLAWRLHNFGVSRADETTVTMYLAIDLFAQGSAIYGMHVVMEATYTPADYGKPIVAPLPLEPVESYVDPFVKGQHRQYRISTAKLVGYRHGGLKSNKPLIPSELPPADVSIRVSCAGNPIAIATIPSSKFRHLLHDVERPRKVTITSSIVRDGDDTIHLSEMNLSSERIEPK